MRYSTDLMKRARPTLLSTIAAGALGLAGLGAQADEMQEITVTVPAVQTIGRDASGTPIQQVTASERVQYDPIMLTTNSGRALLQDRVAAVARKLCQNLNLAVPRPGVDEDTGVRQAPHRAKAQIAAATGARKVG